MKVQIYDVEVTDEVSHVATRYAQYCPDTIPVHDYCAQLIHLLLFSPDRMIAVPGTNRTIDKLHLESVLIATAYEGG